MSSQGRSIYNSNPGAFDATQAGVSIGDLVVDPAGVNPPGLVAGPNSARTVALLGSGGIQQSGVQLVITTPGGPGTARLTFEVRDPGPNTPISGALVQAIVKTVLPSTLNAGTIGPQGSLAGSVLDADAQGTLLVFGATSALGFCDFDISGTNGAAIDVLGVVLNPGPSAVTKNGTLVP
jgi:hypothetical protein